MLRNWSKWSILFPCKFLKWNFSKFHFDPEKISIVFDHFLIEIDRSRFQKILIVGLRIKIDWNLFPSLGQQSKLIEIILKIFDRCQNFDANFEVQNDRNWSKFFRKISKWSISFRISFRFVLKTHRNKPRTKISQHPGANLTSLHQNIWIV